MTKNLSKIIIVIAIFLTSCHDKQITCVIKGKVIGVSSDSILLNKATDDMRYSQVYIPIIDSLFEYTLTIPQTEPYELIYLNDYIKGGMRPILIFPENGV